VKWLKIAPDPDPPLVGDPWEGLPRCVRCGHLAAAHDPDPPHTCMVNAHDGAEGPECECEGYDDGSEEE
jgi:hypothetical protein